MMYPQGSGSTPAPATFVVASVQSFDDPVGWITRRIGADQMGREQFVTEFVVDGAWLTGQPDTTTHVLVRAAIARQPWRGGREQVFLSAVWSHEFPGTASAFREIREPVLEFARRAQATDAVEAFLDDLTSHPEWLLAVEDGEATTLRGALDIAKGGER